MGEYRADIGYLLDVMDDDDDTVGVAADVEHRVLLGNISAVENVCLSSA